MRRMDRMCYVLCFPGAISILPSRYNTRKIVRSQGQLQYYSFEHLGSSASDPPRRQFRSCEPKPSDGRMGGGFSRVASRLSIVRNRSSKSNSTSQKIQNVSFGGKCERSESVTSLSIFICAVPFKPSLVPLYRCIDLAAGLGWNDCFAPFFWPVAVADVASQKQRK